MGLGHFRQTFIQVFKSKQEKKFKLLKIYLNL